MSRWLADQKCARTNRYSFHTLPKNKGAFASTLNRFLRVPFSATASAMQRFCASLWSGASRRWRRAYQGAHDRDRSFLAEAPDYETSSDHVVRSAAAEIRKRLAQYYQDEGIGASLKIELQRGAYLPQFRHIVEEEQRSLEELIPGAACGVSAPSSCGVVVASDMRRLLCA